MAPAIRNGKGARMPGLVGSATDFQTLHLLPYIGSFGTAANRTSDTPAGLFIGFNLDAPASLRLVPIHQPASRLGLLASASGWRVVEVNLLDQPNFS